MLIAATLVISSPSSGKTTDGDKSLKLRGIAFNLLCLFGLVILNQGHCYGQTPCEAEIEQWKGVFVELQEAIDKAQNIKDASVSQAIRERVSRRQRDESMADAIRDVLDQKTSQVVESQEQCWTLAEQEKTAYQRLSRCASGVGGRRDPSVNLRIKELARERDKAIRNLKYVMTDQAYLQYVNQRPLIQDDYSYKQQSPSRAWYSSY